MDDGSFTLSSPTLSRSSTACGSSLASPTRPSRTERISIGLRFHYDCHQSVSFYSPNYSKFQTWSRGITFPKSISIHGLIDLLVDQIICHHAENGEVILSAESGRGRKCRIPIAFADWGLKINVQWHHEMRMDPSAGLSIEGVYPALQDANDEAFSKVMAALARRGWVDSLDVRYWAKEPLGH